MLLVLSLCDSVYGYFHVLFVSSTAFLESCCVTAKGNAQGSWEGDPHYPRDTPLQSDVHDA